MPQPWAVQCLQVTPDSFWISGLSMVGQVQQTVQYRRQHDTDDDQKNHPGIKRVNSGEQCAVIGDRRIYRAHAAKQHRGVEKGVAPGQVFKMHIAENARQQG